MGRELNAIVNNTKMKNKDQKKTPSLMNLTFKKNRKNKKNKS